MQKGYYNYVGIYTSSFMAIGMLFPLLGQYLSSIGFTGVQIGVITATATAIGIGASPFWGCRYHNSKNSKRIVLFLCTFVMLVVVGLLFIKEYVLFLIIYALFTFFQAPIMPLSDAMTLEARMPFGAVKKWGAIGFALGVFIAGQIAYLTGLVIIFPLCAFGFFITGLIVWLMMRRKKSKETNGTLADTKEMFTDTVNDKLDCDFGSEIKEKTEGFGVLFSNKRFMALLFSAFFICGTNIANNNYFGFLYTGVGGSVAGIGIAFLLMCGSEAPFMAWTERISSKFTQERMILISMIISALRYFWYSTRPSPELLIGTFFLQGMVNGIILIEFVKYIAKLVEPAMIGMAMTLYQAISSNCSTIICQLIGGAILDSYSGVEVYLFFGIYNVIGIILYVGFGLHQVKLSSVGV